MERPTGEGEADSPDKLESLTERPFPQQGGTAERLQIRLARDSAPLRCVPPVRCAA